MSKNKQTAPFNDLKEIDYRRQQLRKQINRQERILMKDADAYEDDIETFKRLWSRVKGVRHLKDNFSTSGIAQAVRTVRTLPIGGKTAKKSGKLSRIATAFSLGAELVGWIVNRRRKKK